MPSISNETDALRYFQGFLHLAGILGVLAALNAVVKDVARHGVRIDWALIRCTARDAIPYSVVIYAYLFLTAMVVFVLVRAMDLRLISLRWATRLFLSLNISVLVVPAYFITRWDFGVFTALPLSIYLVALFCKLHSFFVMNRWIVKILDTPKLRSAVSSPSASSSSSSLSPPASTATPAESKKTPRKSHIDVFDQFPAHLCFKDFAYFLVAPTLLYELSYPKTMTPIRWKYVVWQFLQVILCIALMYGLFLQFCAPALQQQWDVMQSPIVFLDFGRVAFPQMAFWLLGAYALFHCFLNGVAELTHFADRRWQSDWWNADSVETFWKRWNLPTHSWFLRHAYLEFIHRFKLSKNLSVWLTFALSALMHEVIMAITFRSVKPWLFLAMISQNLFMMIDRIFKPSPTVGNVLVWLSLFLGQPLLSIIYFRDWFLSRGNTFCGSSLS